MPTPEKLDAHSKALRLNLDAKRYGTFAEIGAGQEVARWFFRVGGAAGTIAKTISAYDMSVSDAIYGPVKRYVSRERLQSMLDYEHHLNIERLSEKKGATIGFFAFADTVAARSFKGNNECHGWMGIKFQSHPRDQDSQIIIHVRMLDTENALQQEALGTVGVNLIYGACCLFHDPTALVESLLDSLTVDRIEIDMIEFSGIEFRHVDNRLMSMKLVQLGLTGAAMFGPNGAVLQPSEAFHKKHILVEPGRFRPVTHAHVNMLRDAHAQFARDLGFDPAEVEPVAEITMRNLRDPNRDGAIDTEDFLARADTLGAIGMPVLISDFSQFYRLARYLNQSSKQSNAVVVGVPALADLFDPKYYADLQGGILEAIGRLFANDLIVYVSPTFDQSTQSIVGLHDFRVAPDLEKLFAYLVDAKRFRPLEQWDESALRVHSIDVIRCIDSHDDSWQAMVPCDVANVIKQRGLFGCRKATA